MLRRLHQHKFGSSGITEEPRRPPSEICGSSCFEIEATGVVRLVRSLSNLILTLFDLFKRNFKLGSLEGLQRALLHGSELRT